APPVERRHRLGSAPRERDDRLGLHIDEEVARLRRRVVRCRRAEAELLELPDRLVLRGDLEEQLRALEGRLRWAARQSLVAEELQGGEVEDGLVDGPDPSLTQDLAEGLPQRALPFGFLRRRDGDRLAKRPVDQSLDAHLRTRPQ